MSRTVLVVDDEPLVLELLVAELRREYEVLAAFSFEEAIAYLEADDLCAVVADWRLGPGKDGIELLKEVRDSRPAVARLMVSGHVGDYLTEVVVDSGLAHACFRKPWDYGAILAQVNRLVEMPSDFLIANEVASPLEGEAGPEV